MRAPRSPITIGDFVIIEEGRLVEIKTAEWHVGYSQWQFNKGKDEFFESRVSYYLDKNKNKWRKYKW